MNEMHVNEPLLQKIIQTQVVESKKVAGFENQLDGVEKGVIRILSYLENDEAMGTKGIVHKQKDMSKRVSKIENDLENQKIKQKTQTRVIAGIVAFASTVGGLVAKYIL